MTELTDRTAETLSVGLAARQFSCRELMHATLERIERVNPRCNAIVSLRDRDALEHPVAQHVRRLPGGVRQQDQLQNAGGLITRGFRREALQLAEHRQLSEDRFRAKTA